MELSRQEFTDLAECIERQGQELGCHYCVQPDLILVQRSGRCYVVCQSCGNDVYVVNNLGDEPDAW